MVHKKIYWNPTALFKSNIPEIYYIRAENAILFLKSPHIQSTPVCAQVVRSTDVKVHSSKHRCHK